MQPSAMHAGQGILAIWNDCAPGEEEAMEAWYLSEHLAERVGIDGFMWGRRYEAITTGPAYMTYYQTRDPAVLSSAAYLDRVNDPTPETARIMADVFRGMSRTVCRRSALSGRIRSTHAVAVALGPAAEMPALADLPEPDHPALTREIWENAEPPSIGASAEESLRGHDQKVGAAVLIDCHDAAAARAMVSVLEARWPSAQPTAYRLICTLAAEDVH